MRIADLDHRLAELGALPVHRDQIVRAWLRGHALDTRPRRYADEGFLPLSLRNNLADISDYLDNLAHIHSEHSAADGSVRLLVRLADGQMVESVLLPRDGVCVSTQVGCAVGCRFCMTGKSGLLRQVSSLEILAQVVLARRIRPVKKVVFMGMGEPAHNLDNVIEAIDMLGSYGDFNHKKLVFSTVGDLRVFERLPQLRVRPALALSLHTTKNELREHLLPKAPKITPAELIELSEIYARKVGYPIQYQWTLLKGINDGQDELDEIVRLLKGKFAVLNLIPFNSMEGDDYQRPEYARITEILHYLHCNGVLTTIRNSAGQEVDGGCGQLRARADIVNTSRLHAS
jgi:23S rRNA (adenine2503-C2)-methyltransferase